MEIKGGGTGQTWRRRDHRDGEMDQTWGRKDRWRAGMKQEGGMAGDQGEEVEGTSTDHDVLPKSAPSSPPRHHPQPDKPLRRSPLRPAGGQGGPPPSPSRPSFPGSWPTSRPAARTARNPDVSLFLRIRVSSSSSFPPTTHPPPLHPTPKENRPNRPRRVSSVAAAPRPSLPRELRRFYNGVGARSGSSRPPQG